MNRPKIAFLFILVALVAASLVLPTRSSRAEASKPAGDVEKKASTDADIKSGGVSEETWAEKTKKIEKSIDTWFGEYIVSPIATVLFYGFGSEKWAGANIPLVVVWLAAGAIFFTIRMGFINVRGFVHAIKLTRGDYDDPNEVGEVTHFQALASALSATVGLGNIAGVAIAISIGGPGACFWIVIVGLLGMSSKFAECTLGQMYRKVAPDGTVSGGPMHYLRDGLAEMGLGGLGKVLALMFTVLCIGASFGGGNAFQINQSLTALKIDPAFEILKDYPIIYGIIMAVMVGIVIIGGIKRIGAAAGAIVPFMCTAYVLTALYIIFSNPTGIIPAFQQIFDGAFKPEGIEGGIVGVLVIGIRRAVFSNEAGIGSAAIAHSAAKTDEPVSEGIVALLEPFIDTVVICTITALLIVITGVCGDNPELAKEKQGAALTVLAFGGEFGVWWFKYILYAAVVMFAFSTLISWSYYGERCWTRLFGPRSSFVYKILFLICTVLGSIISAKNVLDFSDLMILAMAFPNILGVVLLSGKIRARLDDYWSRYKAGKLERH